jgi:hypothetical protein
MPPEPVSADQSYALGKRKRNCSQAVLPSQRAQDGQDGSSVEASTSSEAAIDHVLKRFSSSTVGLTSKEKTVEAMMVDIIGLLPTLSLEDIRALGHLACARCDMLHVCNDELACPCCDGDAYSTSDLTEDPRTLDILPLDTIRSTCAAILSPTVEAKTRMELLRTIRRVLNHSKFATADPPEASDKDDIGRAILQHLEAKERTLRLVAGYYLYFLVAIYPLADIVEQASGSSLRRILPGILSDGCSRQTVHIYAKD